MRTARNGNVTVAFETFGSPEGTPLLLIAGRQFQMLIWPDEFCAALAGRGFHVARFDNRDMGLSTHLTGTAAPGWAKVMLRPSAAPYRLDDMAGDALAVIDALGWQSAHVAGTSLGGMVAQSLAISHPGRVRTLTSIMSTPSYRIATMPKMAVMRPSPRRPGTPVTSEEDAADEAVALKQVMGSAGLPHRGRAHPRHCPALLPACPRLRGRRRPPAGRGHRLRRPPEETAQPAHPHTRHPRDRRPVIRPKGGRATARAIPGARLVTYPGRATTSPGPSGPP